MSAFTNNDPYRLSAIAEDGDASAVAGRTASSGARTSNWPLPGLGKGSRSPVSSSSASSAQGTPGGPRSPTGARSSPSAATTAASNGAPPPSAPSATRRQKGQQSRDKPPRPSYESAPPQYTLWDVTGPKGERLVDLRNNKFVAKRGGWKRLLFILLTLVILAVGLGVGLGVGLVTRNNSSGTSDQGSSPSGTGNGNGSQPFPQGTWTFPANLDNVTTACTSNPSTFLCYPYHTYGQPSSQSAVTFNWIISNSPSGLSISSSQNPFSLTFGNTTLNLVDANTPNERYTFQVTLDKYVVPTSPIDGSNTQDACWYNGTTVAANLYTRRPPQGNTSAAATSAAGDINQAGWPAWQFAFDLNQTIAGGQNVPNCYKLTNDGVGQPVTTGLTAQPSSSQCGCYWRNYNL